MKKLILLSIFSIVFYGCPNNHINEGCNFPYYEFDMPVSFTPVNKIINIGDTITVSSFIPREKWDRDSNYIFILDSVDFHIGGGIVRMDTLLEKGKHYNFADDFNWIADSIYNFRVATISYTFDYYYRVDGYKIHFNMIPKQKGSYLFTLNSLIGATPNIKGKVIETKNRECRTDAWNVCFMTNEGNNYKELLKESPNKDYNTTVNNRWDEYNTIKGAHCFKVE